MTFSFTFLGHSTFLFRTSGGKRVIVDPWLDTNPMCPDHAKRVRELDLILLTHGHHDHTADAVALAGYVIRFEHGLSVYYAGDTALFGDMRLIGELYRPSIAFLPIGDVFTMGPEQAAKACEWLGVRDVVPMHYGTFPALTGTPARLRELVAASGVRVIELKPGESFD